MSRPSVAPAVVCLVGLRCVGKTTVGRLLAETLEWPFVDLDEALVARWNAEHGADLEGAGALLAAVGQEVFRSCEARVLGELLDAGPPRVIATGGGCVERAESRERLSSARTFWLDAPVEVLADRLRADGTLRPSLTGADPAAELGELARRRAPLYAAAAESAVHADGPPAAVALRIAHRLREIPPTGR